MKLIKNNYKNSKQLLKLHLIKSKTYEQFIKKKSLTNINLTHIVLNLKTALNIIFKFHKNNKHILFIGMPKIIETKVNETTIHTALPTEMNNIILNSAKLNQQIFQNKRLFLSKLKKKPELLIVFNHTKKQALIKESTLEKIPLIEFNFNFSRTCWNYNYNVPGNINSTKNKIIDNIFILILNSLLNRSSKTVLKTKHGINNNKKKKPTIL